MLRRLFPSLLLSLLLTACGSFQAAVPTPVEVTKVVTQIATRVVVVTATPEPTEIPDTPTPKPSATPEPTATATPEVPTIEPSATPIPVTPSPTVPPTAVPLAIGDSVSGKIIRTIRLFNIPNEIEGREAGTAQPGDIVDVLYSGGQWYWIKKGSIEGWIYRDWVEIAEADAARIQPYPVAWPVIVTKISQTFRNGYTYWSGAVMNIGAKPATDVQVEISLHGQIGDTQTNGDHQTAYVDSRNLEPGQTSNFVVRTQGYPSPEIFFLHKVLWTAK